MVSEFNSQMLRFGFLFFFFFFPCLRDKSFGEGCRGRQVLEEEKKKIRLSLGLSSLCETLFFFFLSHVELYAIRIVYM